MQELIVNILLSVVILTAAGLLLVVGRRKNGMTKKQKTMLIRILAAAAMLLGLQFLSAELFSQLDEYLFPSAGRWVRFALYLVDYFIIGYDILRKAIKGIINRQVAIIRSHRRVITPDNKLITLAHIGRIIWIYQIIKSTTNTTENNL